MKEDENPELEELGIMPDTEDLEPEVLMDDVEFVQSTEDGDELPGDQKIKKLQEKIKLLEKEKTEYLDGWQRARADYANLQKTTDEDKKRLRSLIEENFIAEILPVVDSFAMAMSNKDAWEKVDPNWRTGVEYIYNQLMTVLREHNLDVFGKVGEAFDPMLHEAVSDKETDDESLDHTIASVLQQGYKLGDIVLRAARVVVLKVK
jgi:molecular chaperone GrpE